MKSAGGGVIGRDFVALISGFDDETGRGGIFRYDGRGLEQLDDRPSTGLTVDRGTLAQVLRSAEDAAPVPLIVHGMQGATEIAVEGLVDPHDIVWTGDAYAIACAGVNRIVYVSPAGEVVGTWQAPGHGDAWHLNSLLLVGGELHVCAFGRHERHRQWNEPGADPSSGFVLNLATGAEVVSGCFSPHHPRFVDGEWIICDSGRRALTRIDAGGRRAADVVLDGWTRGLAVLDGSLLVGESPGRTEPSGVTATVAVVDRASWQVVERFPVPAREVYDIVLAPTELVASIRG
jgi:hypothetical protein